MSVLGLLMITFVGMGAVAAACAALYAALPRSFLDYAVHGRFHGLKPNPLVIPNGTPTAEMPEASLSGQAA
jgi:multisubunit Na+/H+ antiporter MnhB subunit